MTHPVGRVMPHGELVGEQDYFDIAADAREERRREIRAEWSMVRNTWTDGPAVGADIRRQLDAVGSPDSAVALARFDLEGKKWYVGLAPIWNDKAENLVVSWNSPLVKSYYEREDVLELKRVFATTGNTIEYYIDPVPRRVTGTVPKPEAAGADDVWVHLETTTAIDDALLAELERERTGQLGQVVATIQREQYAAVSAPFEGALVVQGGPGTGKTIVGLHRASYLLANERERLRHRRLLVVGPSGRFMAYVSRVLPSLGDADVTQTAFVSLGLGGLRLAGSQEPEADRAVARIKADPRMAEVLARAVARRRKPVGGTVAIQTRQGRAMIGADAISDFIARHQSQPYNEGRELLREELSVLAATALRLGAANVGSDPAVNQVLDKDRIWPRLTSRDVLRDLLHGRARLREAAAGTLSDGEQELLLSSAKPGQERRWTRSDVPLLDELEEILNGRPDGYEHIVVDEAQDLTPMQLRSLRRRSTTGSFTILGDLAQATGVWSYADWTQLVGQLGPASVTVVELRHSYRVPAPVLEAVAPLMRAIAPGLSGPLPTLSGSATTGGEDYPRPATGTYSRDRRSYDQQSRHHRRRLLRSRSGRDLAGSKRPQGRSIGHHSGRVGKGGRAHCPRCEGPGVRSRHCRRARGHSGRE